MFEIGIISIIVLAVGYWVTLWLMSRHDDVLHGDFVHAEDGIEAPVLPDPPFVERPPFPPKPVLAPSVTRRSAITPVAANRVSARPAAARPSSAGTSSTASAPASSAPSLPRTDRTDTLQALLASIKRDLKDASQL